VRRYQTANHRAFLRSLSEFDKARRATEDEGDDQWESGDGNAESEVGPSDDWLSPRPSDVSEEIDPALTTVSTTTTLDDRAIDSIVPTGPVDSNRMTPSFATIDYAGTTAAANTEKPPSIVRGFLPTEPNDPIESALNNPYVTQAGIEPHYPGVHRAEVVPVRTDPPGCGVTAPVERLPAAVALVVSIVLLLYCATLSAMPDRRVNAHNRDGVARADASAKTDPVYAKQRPIVLRVSGRASKPSRLLQQRLCALAWSSHARSGEKQQHRNSDFAPTDSAGALNHRALAGPAKSLPAPFRPPY
jgi:hypothetical protein